MSWAESMEGTGVFDADCVFDDCAGVYGGRDLSLSEEDCVCVWAGEFTD